MLMDDLVHHLEQAGINQVILSAYGFKTPLLPQNFLLSVEFNEALLNSLPLKLIDGNTDGHGAIVKLPLSQERLRKWNRQERTPILTVYPRIMHRLKAVMSHSTYSEISDRIGTFNKRIVDLRNIVEILKSHINGNEVLDESMTGFRMEYRLNADTMLEVREMVLGNNLFILEDIFPRFEITLKFVPYYLYFQRLDQMLGILSTHKSLQQRDSNQVPVQLQSMLADTINMFGFYNWRWMQRFQFIENGLWWRNDPAPVWIPENYDVHALLRDKDFRNNLVCPFEGNHNLARSQVGTRGPDPQSKFTLRGSIEQLRMICKWCKVNLTEKTLLRILRDYFEESGESFNDYPEFYIDDDSTESNGGNLEDVIEDGNSEDASDDRNLYITSNDRNSNNAGDNGSLDSASCENSIDFEENDDNDVIDVDEIDILVNNPQVEEKNENIIDIDVIDSIEDNQEGFREDSESDVEFL
ncbi:hypothetical protein HK098_007760, partial [Nowakowskiella sp. JEL0407]